MDPKFRRRFFEPLILCEALCRTQGDRITEESALSQGPLPRRAIPFRREIIRHLCRMCDFEKGGETVTAMVLEQTPQGPVYWFSVSKHRERITDFLKSTLDTIHAAVGANPWFGVRPELRAELLSSFTHFTAPRLRDYLRLLNNQIEGAKEVLERNDRTSREHQELYGWIVKLQEDMCTERNSNLYQLAYIKSREEQLSALMQVLEHLQTSNGIKKGLMLEHYLGRLSSVVRAANILSQAGQQPHLFSDFDVKFVPCGQTRPAPSPQGKLTLEKLAHRMVPSHQPARLRDLTDALTRLNHTMNLMGKIQEQYHKTTFKLRVHAELALLEAVHAEGVRFYDNDKYIGCSKGACFCCYHYICHHPGNFVRPGSHNNIWLNWAEPFLPESSDGAAQKSQRDLLMKVNNDIRAKAIERALSQSGSMMRHPDSSTGLTRSSVTGFVTSRAEHGRQRSSSSDSTRAAFESDSSPSEVQTPPALDRESDSGDGGVDLVSAQVAGLRF